VWVASTKKAARQGISCWERVGPDKCRGPGIRFGWPTRVCGCVGKIQGEGTEAERQEVEETGPMVIVMALDLFWVFLSLTG
jgi:hypothetical protein